MIDMERSRSFLALLLSLSTMVFVVRGEDPYLYFDWSITYGTIAPLGVPQQGILINGQFPGPRINCTSNNNIVVNVHNKLDEPFLLTWAGIQHRKNSWQDGTPGTMCPILPGTNYTYHFQVKDQIGSFFYFPTLGLHRAVGAIGPLDIHSRDLIPVPFQMPASEFNVLIGDWYVNKGHQSLKNILDIGRSLGRPDGIQINGKSAKVGDNAEPLFTMESGKTYRFRVCNVGMRTSINIRIQGHYMKLVEMEGSHTVQNLYSSFDVHVSQCLSFMVIADQEPMDYYLVASSRFLQKPISSVAIIRYANGNGPASPELPLPPPENSVGIAWSMNQFRSFRWNLTASAARPNPQGSYHYGDINITRTIKLVNSRKMVNGKLRYGINGVSHVNTDTPLKLAEYFGVKNVFTYDLVKDEPSPRVDQDNLILKPSVINGTFRNFVEIIFENHEKTIQSWSLDGYAFFAVATEPGIWSPKKRVNYNLLDAISRHTIQVYPGSWAAVMTTLDNAGMWNLRSEMWERVYLGQQLYVSVLSPARSLRDEYNLPDNQLLCGKVVKMPMPPPYTA